VSIPAFGGLAFAERMYMARCELAGIPRVRVYEVDPKSVYVPNYKAQPRPNRPSLNDGGYKARIREVPRQERAWFGCAARKLCSPGFAAFGGSQLLALESLQRVMRDHRDKGEVTGLGEAIRCVAAALEHARRQTETV
jgi:hypothetical protein